MSFRGKVSSFDKKNLAGVAVVAFSVLMLSGFAVSQSSSSGDVVIGSNGVDINTGQLMMNGNDIVDGGTTIWDASAGQVPEAAYNPGALVWSDLGINQSDVSKSDVGLGNVENFALSNSAGGLLTWDSTNTEFDVQEGSISHDSISGVSSSDHHTKTTDTTVDGCAGCLSIGTEVSNSIPDLDGGASGDGSGLHHAGFISSGPAPSTDYENIFEIHGTGFSDVQIDMVSNDVINLETDADATSTGCQINLAGDLNCDGTKSWIHSINKTHEAYYTSQESPKVRAVYEGKAHIVDSKKIELPNHFSKTVSDSEPMLRAQVTPQGTLTKAAVMEKTDDYIKIAVGKETDVNFRITGIREGYEDKQVVRQKEE